MDPVRNPYSPGAGTPPPALVGREDELEEFDIAVQRLGLGRSSKSLMLTGLRGVGKTVLLREFGQTAKRYGWVHQSIEATEDLALPAAMAMLTRKALLSLSAGERRSERVRRAFGVLSSFRVSWNLPDGGDVSVGLDPIQGVADSGLLDDDLADLFTEVGEVAKTAGTGVLLTIDEIQYLSRGDLAALIVGLHRISQEQLPFMVAGAGLPSVPALAGEAKSYAERLFTYRVIDSLPGVEARAALTEPTVAEGVTWQPAALDCLVDITGGYPYFLQEFGGQAWDMANGPDEITRADVESAIPIAFYELDTGFFRVRIDRTTDSEREYLKAMAQLGSGIYASGDVAAKLGKVTTQVGPIRDALIKKGLCYSPRHGEIAFTVPMFDQFIRRWMG